MILYRIVGRNLFWISIVTKVRGATVSLRSVVGVYYRGRSESAFTEGSGELLIVCLSGCVASFEGWVPEHAR